MRFLVLVAALAVACSPAREDEPDLRAFGNEPFWNVTISVADGIVYGRLGEPDVRFPYSAPVSVAEGSASRVWGPVLAAEGEHEIQIRLSEEPCQDTMADIVHPMRATVTLDGEVLTGCARRLDDPPTETP